MTRYPQLEEPLPPGHITLKDYAPQTGRALGTIETHWRPKPGFPEPVGELPSRGRQCVSIVPSARPVCGA